MENEKFIPLDNDDESLLSFEDECDMKQQGSYFSRRISEIRSQINSRCDHFVKTILQRKIELLSKLDQIEANYENENIEKEKLSQRLVYLKDKAETLFMQSQNNYSNFLSDHALLCDSQIEVLHEGVRKLINFRWDSDLEEKVAHLGELEIIAYDYLSKDMPVVATCDSGSSPGDLNWPRSIAIEPKSLNIFIANYKNNRVEVFSPNGKFLFNFGGSSDFVKLYNPHGVCILKDRVYVVELRSNGRLICFSLNGKYLMQCKKTFQLSGRLTCDPEADRIYVVNENDYIPVLTSEFGLLGNFADTQFCCACDLKIHLNEVFVMDKASPCVHVFSKGGIFKRNIPISRGPKNKQVINPQTFAIDHFGYFVMSGSNSHCIFIFSPSGKLVKKIGSKGNNPGTFVYPHGIATDSAGRIISVCERRKFGLQIF